MNNQEFINEINAKLNTIAIINSFIDDGKTYYIALIPKEEHDFTLTLRKHFNVKNWTFDVTEVTIDWMTVLKDELLFFFGQYILQAKQPFIKSEYEGKRSSEFDDISKNIILNSRTNCEFLLDNFLINIKKIIGETYTFNKVVVNWEFPNGYEKWYECYEKDYLFDMGEQILFLHFGISD